MSRRLAWREPSTLPGFAPSLSLTLLWLGALVIAPLAAMVASAAGLGWSGFWALVLRPRVLADLSVSVSSALAASAIDACFGLIIAWVLARYRFPGRRLVDALIDLPFALPTAVAGIALAALYAPQGPIGAALAPFGVAIAYTRAGIVVALMFVGLPFVVRTLEPVIEELEVEQEEAASMLGASDAATFLKVILPPLLPALLAGFALALARGLGEYGSVIFIAGNKPMVSEILPLLIVTELEQFNLAGATAIAVLMLAASFLLLIAVNLLQAWIRRRHGG
ncbi:MAG TPA: sulfate ABC transporter permease subunit CysT [Acetobacteraceae bacterium]|nr:sulfate ABC transporter permease subunit CysT [Acetobacteraceae bacterium]